VPSASRDGFARGQESWRALVAVPGFLGQCGGFAGDHARVFGLWADEEAYAEFMRVHHDPIAAKADQRRWYETLSVDVFTRVPSVPQACADFAAALTGAKFVRVVEGGSRAESEERFRAMQEATGDPGMSASPGLLGGDLWRHTSDPQRYLGLTFWAGSAGRDADPKRRDGDRVVLQPTWTVSPRLT
jgi:heme-degrading monooxygenase HmoA